MSLLGPEDPPIDQILEAIDEMAASPQPKVLLFDIGGVCVISPFQAILDYELSLSIPPGWINYSISRSAPSGAWHKLERGAIPLDKHFFAAFNADLHKPENWKTFYDREASRHPDRLPKQTPPIPKMDGEWLFNEMMSASNAPDPWMFPALKKLKQSGKYIIGALSNTVIFPESHKLHKADFFKDALRSQFDVFISSAHVGIRKPDPRMYKLAVETLDTFARGNAGTKRGRKYGWEAGVKSQDILFLDDIGENLKAAKKEGFETVKVPLGRAYEAVEKLEKVTGLELDGGHPKVAIKPSIKGSKAKI
ncbi:hypothetical protein QQS21_008601 [Conoideocrella luteorostrata]|uniref:Epoxide hydrolase n=1 Tax=Conoideocrella luteorostrata TaxID=1105319 RepID=A0AAJ0CIK1_9HYPO|nr:hypothetical protein QQS21_008601 [Conoideocrella luteorostrata]